jgi:hypothetical protein
MTRRAAVVAAALSVSVVAGTLLGACGDGRPGYCDDLARTADLGALTTALAAKDLPAARQAASDFRDLAEGAPAAVRSDMVALAAAVTDIVGLLSAERTAGPGSAASSSTTSTVGDAPSTSAPATADPADVEQRREELNQRLAALSITSSRVEDWASRNCGISLSGS